MSKRVDAYWRSYLEAQPAAFSGSQDTYAAWSFGNTPAMADELGALVVQGTKTATASLVWAYELEEEPFPKPGDLIILLDSVGNPLCITETVDVDIKPFNKVEEQHAFEEGEGDRTLVYWRKVHWEFFSAECESLGKKPSDSMPVLCERFRLVYK